MNLPKERHELATFLRTAARNVRAHDLRNAHAALGALVTGGMPGFEGQETRVLGLHVREILKRRWQAREIERICDLLETSAVYVAAVYESACAVVHEDRWLPYMKANCDRFVDAEAPAVAGRLAAVFDASKLKSDLETFMVRVHEVFQSRSDKSLSFVWDDEPDGAWCWVRRSLPEGEKDVIKARVTLRASTSEVPRVAVTRVDADCNPIEYSTGPADADRFCKLLLGWVEGVGP